MKRFFVFSGPFYDACGGMTEFEADFDTLQEAQTAVSGILPKDQRWWQILDTAERRMISSYVGDWEPVY